MKRLYTFILFLFLFSINTISGAPVEYLSCDNSIDADRYIAAPDFSKPVGAIPGSLSVSPSGGAVYSVLVDIMPGIDGVQPEVSLVYNSQGGDGALGWGWSLSGGSAIQRVGSTIHHDGIAAGVQFDDRHDRLSLDGQRLVGTDGTGLNATEYRTEVENFARITRSGSGETASFTVRTKDGQTLLYGTTDDSRVTYYGGGYTWLLKEARDLYGRFIRYNYTKNNQNNEVYLSSIEYTGMSSLSPKQKVEFVYGERADSWKGTIGPLRQARTVLLTRIDVKTDGQTVWSYLLNYQLQNARSCLASIEKIDPDGSELNSTELMWETPIIAVSNRTTNLPDWETVAGKYQVRHFSGDFDGDGISDILTTKWNNTLLKAKGNVCTFTLGGANGTIRTDTFSLPPNPILERLERMLLYRGCDVELDEIAFDGASYNMQHIQDVLAADYDGDGVTEMIFVCKEYQLNEKAIEQSAFCEMITGTSASLLYYLLSSGRYECLVYSFKDREFVYKTTVYSDFLPRYRPADRINLFRFDFDNDARTEIIDGNDIYQLHGNAFVKLGSSNQDISHENVNVWGDFNGDGLVDFVTKGGYVYEREYGNYRYLYKGKMPDPKRYLVLGKTDYDQNGAEELIVFDTKDSIDSFGLEMRFGERFYFIDLYERMGYHVDFYWDKHRQKRIEEWEMHDIPIDQNVYFYAVRGRGQGLLVFDSEGKKIKEIEWNERWKLTHVACYDLNSDGKEDIICFNNDVVTCIYYRTDDGYRKESRTINVGKEYFFGDFNGDGHIDLLSVSNNRLWTFMEDFAPYPMIYGMRDGMGVKNELFYKSLTDKTIYAKGSGAEYPTVDLIGPMWVVSRIERDHGVADRKVENYTYKGGKVNMQGKGFFGFSEMTVLDSVAGMTTTTAMTFDGKCGLPLTTTQSMVQGGKSTEQTMTYTVEEVDAARKRFRLRQNSRQSMDLSGNVVHSSYTEDDYGNITAEIIDYGNGVLTENRAYYKLVNTSTRYVCLPDSQTVTQTRGGRSAVQSTVYGYNGSYRLSAKSTYYDRNPVSTESYTYNAKGFLSGMKSKPYSASVWLNSSYEYDDFGRLIKETDPLGLSTAYAYDETGLLASVTDARGNETRYTYTSFGRRQTTRRPDGVTVNEQLLWNTGTTAPEGTLYYTQTSATGQPTERTYYDAAGRELRSEQLRFDGKYLKTDKRYDSRGRLWKVSLPSNATPNRWNVYAYDEHDRPLRVEYASGKRDVWAYSPNKVRETREGVQSTKTYDASGALLSVSDPGGVISYHLRPDGQPDSISLTGGITTRFEYDEYGRQLAIDDPSAGLQTYTYDEAGNMASQTDANGKTTSFVYDAYGRVEYKECPEFLTEYVYTPYDELESETSTNGTARTYMYDKFGRLQIAYEQAPDNQWLQKEYAYEAGRVSSVKYYSPSGAFATEAYLYTNGHRTETKFNEKYSVWKLEAENAQGLPTQVRSGGVMRTYSYDADGLPTGREAVRKDVSFFRQSYSFDAKTGNLNERTDETRGLTEVFSYDGMNRLTGWEVLSGNATAPARYVGYAANGNIESMSGVGSFEYAHDSKPYAVTGVYADSEEELMAHGMGHDITYTSFYRPESIVSDSLITEFTYHASGDRVKMECLSESGDITARYYLGGQYEVDTATDRELFYVGGDAYSAPAVYVRQGDTWEMYYLVRDYLGSICAITGPGGVVAEYSYDPWGRLRNPETLEIYAVGEEPELLFGRGFTGHEHLTDYGLINMNARLYDPVTGRFLSPDPYVQSPDFSQAFNRFSYCWNNPLRYVDEDGEFIITALIVGAVIGAAIGVYSGYKIGKSKGATGGEMVGYMLGGALIGAVGGGAAGAVGAAVGAAVGVGGFLGGAAAGAAAGFTGGLINGAGMSWLGGSSFGNGLLSGLQGGLIGGVAGGVMGGTIQGFADLAKGNSFWNGKVTHSPSATQITNDNTNITRSQLERNRVNGRIAEDVSGINQADKVRIPSSTETAQYRIPDELTNTTLREIKNVSYLDYTAQLQDFVIYSQEHNLQMILQVRPANTIFGPATTFSPALNNAINQYNIIVKPIPFGITFSIPF